MSDYVTPTFCGASVRDIKSSLGWNGQKSVLDVALVEDPLNFDAFLAPTPGTPIWLSIPDSAFKFFGLMHSFQVNYDLSGNPTLSVRGEDVRDILESTIVVTGGYNGATSAVPNLINAFGYWENNLGFGGSESNESGMPWFKILNAVQTLTNTGGGTVYGGPLNYRGYNYKVDLSELPVPPVYYRIPGAETSLLSLIQQICDDGATDFFIELQNTSPRLTIKVRTVSKAAQPELGTISDFIDSLKDVGTAVRATRGLENRNDVTSAFCIGGPRQYLHEITDLVIGPATPLVAASSFGGGGVTIGAATIDLTGGDIGSFPTAFPFYFQIDAEVIRADSSSAIGGGFRYNVTRGQQSTAAAAHAFNQPAYYAASFTPNAYTFWGFDAATNLPLIGVQPAGTWSILDHTITANSAEVADIVGGLTYTCKVIELLTTLVGSDFAMWMTYMRANRPIDFAFMQLSADMVTKSTQIFLAGLDPKQPNDAKDFGPLGILRARVALQGDQVIRHNRIFSFIRKLASDYLGRQYLVRLPFLTFKLVSETTQIVFSEEPTDSGYDEAELSVGPLGLDFLYQQQFVADDGKYFAYIRLGNVLGIDLSRFVNQSGFIVQDDNLYVRVQVDPKPIFLDEITPCAKVTLPSQIFEVANGTNGVDIRLIIKFLHGNELTPAQLEAMNKPQGGIQRNTFVQPPPRHPNGIVIPMKSNVETYGPWFALGEAGKVQFVNDSSIVPWNYGSIANMNLAGGARVVNALSNMLYTESGSIEFAGLPAFNLGDVLDTNGANITDINISYGIDRITTAYRLQTYTQRFGLFNRDADRRLQRLARNDQQNRAGLRQGLVNALQIEAAALAGIQTKLEFQAVNFAKRAFKGQSPHGFLSFYSFDDHSIGVSGETDTDYLARITSVPSGDDLLRVGGMSLDGFFRPFATSTANTNMPRLAPSPPSGYTAGLNCITLNPFQVGNDIELMIRGQTTANECDMHNYWISDTDPSGGTRPLGLRGPLFVVGWGYDLNGDLTPPTPLKNFKNWKAGPVDLHYDNYRGVWSSRDLIFGHLSGSSLSPHSVGTMIIANSSFASGTKTMSVFNPWSVGISANLFITAGFAPYQNKWCVVAADCSVS